MNWNLFVRSLAITGSKFAGLVLASAVLVWGLHNWPVATEAVVAAAVFGVVVRTDYQARVSRQHFEERKQALEKKLKKLKNGLTEL